MEREVGRELKVLDLTLAGLSLPLNTAIPFPCDWQALARTSRPFC